MDSKLTIIIFNRTRDPQSFALFVVICHPLTKPQILIKDLTKPTCNIEFNFLQNQQPFFIKYLEYDLSVQPTSISTDDGAMAYRFWHVVPTNFCLVVYDMTIMLSTGELTVQYSLRLYVRGRLKSFKVKQIIPRKMSSQQWTCMFVVKSSHPPLKYKLISFDFHDAADDISNPYVMDFKLMIHCSTFNYITCQQI